MPQSYVKFRLTLTLSPLQKLIGMGLLLPLIRCYALSVFLSTVYVSFTTIQIRRVRSAREGVRNFLILSGHIHYI